MTTYTSSLPEKLLNRLAEVANELSLPKNKIIERALELLLFQIRAVAKSRLKRKRGTISIEQLSKVKLGLNNLLNY